MLLTYLVIFSCSITAAGFRTLLLYEIVRTNVIASIYADLPQADPCVTAIVDCALLKVYTDHYVKIYLF